MKSHALVFRPLCSKVTATRCSGKGVGHIPSTSLPGESGNVAIAGHRDTFFRTLQDIRRDDDITLATTAGTYHYRVDSLQVVRPNDTQVLAPSDRPSLTLVTCYPFHFVGSAPNRYIVHAQEIDRLALSSKAFVKPRLGRYRTGARKGAQVRQLYRQGLSQAQIARCLTIGRSPVLRVLATASLRLGTGSCINSRCRCGTFIRRYGCASSSGRMRP